MVTGFACKNSSPCFVSFITLDSTADSAEHESLNEILLMGCSYIFVWNRLELRFYIPNANVIVGTFWPTQCLDYAMTHISM